MPVPVPLLLDLGAVLVGGLTGALLAVRKRFDLVGSVSLAIVAGLGGGIIRDVLLQRGPPAALLDSRYLITAVVAAAVGFYRSGHVASIRLALIAVDAVYLGVFSVVGALKALNAGLAPVPSVFLGVVTAVGGGILRDVLAGEPPTLFIPGELYATVSAIGTTVYVALWRWRVVMPMVAAIAAIAIMVVLRLLAVRYGWRLPKPRQQPPGTGLA
jgi:uncharacterized membrane protein YeiH